MAIDMISPLTAGKRLLLLLTILPLLAQAQVTPVVPSGTVQGNSSGVPAAPTPQTILPLGVVTSGGSAPVGISDTQTLSNKTFPGLNIAAGTITKSGSSVVPAQFAELASVALTGTPTSTTNSIGYSWTCNSDNMAAKTYLPGCAEFTYNFGGAALTGGRSGLAVISTFTAESGNSAIPYEASYVGASSTMYVDANDGGTSGTPYGYFYSYVDALVANGSATYLNGLFGKEIDITCMVGCSTALKEAVKIVQASLDATAGSQFDAGLAFMSSSLPASGPNPGWAVVLSFGGPEGYSPVSPTGTLIGGTKHLSGSAMAAGVGIDFTNFVFSGNQYQGPGLTIGPTGGILAAGGSTARPLSASQADVANVLNFGADPTGVADSGAAINAAVANTSRPGSVVGDVHLPAGTYLYNEQISLGPSQCLYGDGDHVTFMVRGYGFSASASGGIVLTGAELGSPCVHDIGFIDTQPAQVSTTASGSYSSGATSITVASIGNAVTGWIAFDSARAGLVSQTTVTISGSGPYTLALSTPVTATGVTSGDTIVLNPARAGALPTGSCVSTQICEYPAVIYDVSANRPRLWNLHFHGAWNCIDTHNVVPTMNNIECGGLNIGWRADGGQDFSHVRGWHDWPFGWKTSGAWGDGTTIGWQIGRMDGLNAEDVDFVGARFLITSDADNSTAPSEYSNVMLDGFAANLEVSGGLANIFTGIYKTGYSATSTCSLNFAAGHTQITNLNIADGTGAGPIAAPICVSGGGLRVSGGIYAHNNIVYPAFSISSGFLDVENVEFSLNATSAYASPLISQTGGTLIATGNSANEGATGIGVSVTSDGASTVVANNALGILTYSLPTGSVLGSYQTFPVAHLPAALSTCGTGQTILAGGTNMSGTINTGSGATACTMTFSQPSGNVPVCLVAARSGTPPVYTTAYSAGTATLTLTTAAASSLYDYWCPVH